MQLENREEVSKRKMPKIFKFKGKTEEELVELSRTELLSILDSRIRRSLSRGYSEDQKILIRKIKKRKEQNNTKPLKTQVRNLIITPDLFGAMLMVYNGKDYVVVEVNAEKLGHRIGEFTKTRRDVSHKAPGIGATKGSRAASVK